MYEKDRELLTNYQYLTNRLLQIRREVEDMDDDYLVEEVVGIDYGECSSAQEVLERYFQNGELSEEDRQILVDYYVLAWIDEDYEE